MRPVFDTNILIDYLAGQKPAKDELERYPRSRISIITWIEVMVGVRETDDEKDVREFLNSFETIPLNENVAEIAVQLRRQYRLKLPDTLIWASAKTTESLLITRNTRDYPSGAPDIRFPYAL